MRAEEKRIQRNPWVSLSVWGFAECAFTGLASRKLSVKAAGQPGRNCGTTVGVTADQWVGLLGELRNVLSKTASPSTAPSSFLDLCDTLMTA